MPHLPDGVDPGDEFVARPLNRDWAAERDALPHVCADRSLMEQKCSIHRW
jgi:hypothetical protein